MLYPPLREPKLAKKLDAIYKQINEELRSQYLLTYYSTNLGGKDQWHKVEVKVEPSSRRANPSASTA